MPDVAHELRATTAAIDKLGARGISEAEAEQLIHNRNVITPNPHGVGDRRLMIGLTAVAGPSH